MVQIFPKKKKKKKLINTIFSQLDKAVSFSNFLCFTSLDKSEMIVILNIVQSWRQMQPNWSELHHRHFFETLIKYLEHFSCGSSA